MISGIKRLCLVCLMLLICIVWAPSAPAEAEDAAYYIGPDDPHYHTVAQCAQAQGETYGVTLAATKEFLKSPCSFCALELEVAAAQKDAALIIKASCTDNAKLSIQQSACTRVIDGDYYFILLNHIGDVEFTVESAGAPYLVSAQSDVYTLDYNHCVVQIERDEDEFQAFDIFGIRLCCYARYSNTSIIEGVVCLDPYSAEISGKFDEYTGEYIPQYETRYALEIPVKGYADRGIVHYWLLTQEEFSHMQSVVIRSGDSQISGEVMFPPFYTGSETMKAMGDTQPWQVSSDGPAQAVEYSNMDAVDAQSDYCGSYRNSSGTITVLVKNPTKKRAREYAEIAGGDIWVIQGEYTLDELSAARREAESLVANSLASSTINPVTNRVELELYGVDVARYADRDLFSPCVNVYYAGELIWDRGALIAQHHDIPRSPQTDVTLDSISLAAYMQRAQYPTDCEYLSFCVELSSGYLPIELCGGLEKYVDGTWKTVAGEYTPNGYDCVEGVFDSLRIMITRGIWSFMIPTHVYEPLGEGLYRLRACCAQDEYAYLEFAVAAGAPPLEPYRPLCPEWIDIPSHTPKHFEADYDSRKDNFDEFSISGWQFRLISLPASESNPNLSPFSSIVGWPDADTNAAQKIYEFNGEIFRMFDAGDGVILLGENNIWHVSFRGEETPLITTKRPIVQALVVGENIFYMTDTSLWRYYDGITEKIGTPKSGTGETLEYYNSTLYATNGAGKTVAVFKSGA